MSAESYQLCSNPRILVIGTSGAGKSRLAGELAAILGVPRVELDALYWGPDWTPRPRADFEAALRRATAQPAWVIDGNYGSPRDLLWPHATHVIWLDYGRATIMARVLRRTLRRALWRERLWAGNRESLRRALFTRDSILRWSWQTFDKNRDAYTALRESDTYPQLHWLRFTRPAQARGWLRRLRAPAFTRRAAAARTQRR